MRSADDIFFASASMRAAPSELSGGAPAGGVGGVRAAEEEEDVEDENLRPLDAATQRLRPLPQRRCDAAAASFVSSSRRASCVSPLCALRPSEKLLGSSPSTDAKGPSARNLRTPDRAIERIVPTRAASVSTTVPRIMSTWRRCVARDRRRFSIDLEISHAAVRYRPNILQEHRSAVSSLIVWCRRLLDHGAFARLGSGGRCLRARRTARYTTGGMRHTL